MYLPHRDTRVNPVLSPSTDSMPMRNVCWLVLQQLKEGGLEFSMLKNITIHQMFGTPSYPAADQQNHNAACKGGGSLACLVIVKPAVPVMRFKPVMRIRNSHGFASQTDSRGESDTHSYVPISESINTVLNAVSKREWIVFC